MTPLDTLLIDAYTGGVNMPTAVQAAANYVARAYQDGSGNVNIEYVPASTAYAADSAVAAALAPLLRGTGLTVASNKLQPRQRPRSMQIKDHFVGGATTSGAIGALGWNLLGSGTPVYSRIGASGSSLSSSSKAQLTTSASTNDRTVLCLGETESRTILAPSEITIAQCTWNHNAVLTSHRVFFGFSADFAVNSAAVSDCIGIYYDSAVSPNYQIIARAGSVGSPTMTSAVVPSNTAELVTIMQPTAGTFQFYIGNTLIGTIASGIPTNALNVGVRLETLTTAARTVRLGYFGLECNGIAQANDDDTFLEV